MEVKILGYSNSNIKVNILTYTLGIKHWELNSNFKINIGLPGQSHLKENIGFVYMLRMSCKGMFVFSGRDGEQSRNLFVK